MDYKSAPKVDEKWQLLHQLADQNMEQSDSENEQQVGNGKINQNLNETTQQLLELLCIPGEGILDLKQIRETIYGIKAGQQLIEQDPLIEEFFELCVDNMFDENNEQELVVEITTLLLIASPEYSYLAHKHTTDEYICLLSSQRYQAFCLIKQVGEYDVEFVQKFMNDAFLDWLFSIEDEACLVLLNFFVRKWDIPFEKLECINCKILGFMENFPVEVEAQVLLLACMDEMMNKDQSDLSGMIRIFYLPKMRDIFMQAENDDIIDAAASILEKIEFDKVLLCTMLLSRISVKRKSNAIIAYILKSEIRAVCNKPELKNIAEKVFATGVWEQCRKNVFSYDDKTNKNIMLMICMEVGFINNDIEELEDLIGDIHDWFDGDFGDIADDGIEDCITNASKDLNNDILLIEALENMLPHPEEEDCDDD